MATGCVLLAALAAVPPPAEATLPGQNGKIAFTSDRGVSGDFLYTVNPDGSAETRVPIIYNARTPSWAWDGASLAVQKVQGETDIHSLMANGTGNTNLTPYTLSDVRTPTWAPTGRRIAFANWTSDQIYILEVGTTNEQALVFGEDPSWSPDGSTIAFSRDHDIWTVGLDGSSATNLTNNPQSDLYPDWSPDGSRIAYMRLEPGVGYEIYVMDADGSNKTRVTYTPGLDRSPSWSPDGSRIAFASDMDGDYEIYTMLADGSDIQQVTDNPARDDDPAWQPLPTSVTGFYPRPAGATPIRASLVTAFQACVSPNRTHGPPLASPSCNPPRQPNASGSLPEVIVGTPDSNGYAASSEGSVRIATEWHVGPPEDSDVRIDVSITDVHCSFASAALCAGGGTRPDYAGELRASAELQVTDRDNRTTYPGPAWPATNRMAEVFANVPCAPTPDTLVGSTCSTATTLNSVVPGLVKEGLRSIWDLGPIEIHSGGSDGDVNTTGNNTLFMTQGVFVP